MLDKDENFETKILRVLVFIRICKAQNQIKFSFYIFITCLITAINAASGRSPLPQFAQRYTVQDCIGGESMATCDKLSHSRFKPNVRGQKFGTSTIRPSRRSFCEVHHVLLLFFNTERKIHLTPIHLTYEKNSINAFTSYCSRFGF